jgi:hypothetical protein
MILRLQAPAHSEFGNKIRLLVPAVYDALWRGIARTEMRGPNADTPERLLRVDSGRSFNR